MCRLLLFLHQLHSIRLKRTCTNIEKRITTTATSKQRREQNKILDEKKNIEFVVWRAHASPLIDDDADIHLYGIYQKANSHTHTPTTIATTMEE